MCGRYTLASAEDLSDFEDITNEIQRSETARKDILQGDIYPTDLAPVLIPENRMAIPKLVVWGFPGFKGKGVIINARAETAPSKPLFSGALSYGRCVIPSTGFFEWDKRTKQKYQFNLPDSRALYMAGLVREFEGQRRFVILTTSANESMQDIHDRMPVILDKNDIEAWLYDSSYTGYFLQRTPPVLEKRAV